MGNVSIVVLDMLKNSSIMGLKLAHSAGPMIDRLRSAL